MHGWLCAALSVAMLVLAQPPWDFWPLGAVAIAPWLAATAEASLGRALRLGFALGLGFGLAIALWIPDALATLGASTPHAILALLLIAAWGKGIPFALAALAVHALRHRSAWIRILGTALTWLGIDTWVSESKLGLPWALLGHSQAAAPGVAQLATLAGVPLISALLSGVNQAVALVWEARGSWASSRRAAALAAAWIALALVGAPLAELARTGAGSEGRKSILLVQPAIPRGERWAPALQALNLERVAGYSMRALSSQTQRPDVVVWPENLLTAPIDADSALAASLERTVDALAVPLILGAVRAPREARPPHYRSSVLWLVPGAGITASIDKARAVPGLEALGGPASRWIAAHLLADAGVGPRVEQTPRAAELRGPFPLAAVLCFEVLFPGLVAERRTPESVAILNLADDSWTESWIAREQMLAFARFRAIEQRLSLLRVTHGGLSAVIDPFGRIVAQLPRDTYGHRLAEVAAFDPPGWLERLLLVALPSATGLGVWWMPFLWTPGAARLVQAKRATDTEHTDP